MHQWWTRVHEVCGDRARLVVTTWPGRYWDPVQRMLEGFTKTIPNECIVDTSPFSRDEGEQLYALLDKEEDFDGLWGGSPGSLVISHTKYHDLYRLLQEDREEEIIGSWLLDAAKVLTDAEQPQ